jgi:transketolase
MSSLEAYQVLYDHARLRPDEPLWADRDRVFVSHGHTSPGVYVALADNGFFELDDAVAHFRQAGSPFEGHVERDVPGVEWSTGNLGQGLSAGVGAAIAARLTGRNWHTYVAMSDGEQMKGQVGEARRLAAKYRLCDLSVVVDLNRVQISGHTSEVMPVGVRSGFEADGWGVIEVDGHDPAEIYEALARARCDLDRPYAVLAHTIIGKGVSFMEDEPEFHGRGLTEDEYGCAMAELGLDPAWLARARERRPGLPATKPAARPDHVVIESAGGARTYTREKHTDCRSAWGSALADIAMVNPDTPMTVFDCDLKVSVKTGDFERVRPEAFIEAGVGEHNVATASGAASVNGVLSFWSDFGVFGLDEAYNQQRLNDINGAGLKLALTHCGLDVGDDGCTHQCIDYVGALRDFYGWRLIVPADPDQTDRAVRAAAAMPGCVAIIMGRSKLPVILGEDGEPFFAGESRFEYGAIDEVRSGGIDITVITMGTLAGAAVDAADALRAEGRSVRVGVAACPLALEDEFMERAMKSRLLVTVEDHNVRSGLGASVADWVATRGAAARLLRLGVEGYQSSGASADLFRMAGLDTASLAQRILEAL